MSNPGRAPAMLEGEVLQGTNTIYTVRAGDRRLLCRIKGKQLRAAERAYNPIAPGDRVRVAPDVHDAGKGLVCEVLPRRTRLVRWNKKGRAAQLIAANADVAACVTSSAEPPFRPRFIDRLVVAAETGGLRPLVILNKADLPETGDTGERLAFYARLGYEVLRCSSRTGEGVAEVARRLCGHTTVLVGQSGVGKSSLINALDPAARLRVGGLSRKHDRGSHTTTLAVLLDGPSGLRIIDTPGVRELEIADVLPDELAFHFPEFRPFMNACSFQPCLHAGEPGCAVEAAAAAGEVHIDRYESYLRMMDDLRAARTRAHG